MSSENQEEKKQGNLVMEDDEEEEEEESVPDYSQWEIPKTKPIRVTSEDSGPEEDDNIEAYIEEKSKTLDKFTKKPTSQSPSVDLGTQPILDQIGKMKDQLSSRLADQVAKPPLQQQKEKKDVNNGHTLPTIDPYQFDFSSSDSDEEIESLSYEEWKAQQQLKKKQQVLDHHLKQNISPASLFDRLTSLESHQTSSQPLFKPQMSDAEHIQFLKWMFPLASSYSND